MATLDDAIEAIRLGDRDEGRQILEGLLEGDEGNEQVWLWLSTVVDGDEDREVCLENVLAINSANGIAQRGLDALRAGRFNPRDIMSEALGGVEEEEQAGSTFIDEFRRSSGDDDSDDDEIVLPSTMAKAGAKGQKKQAAKKQGGGFKLNPRLIILAVLILLVICALAGVAAYNLFLGGDTSGGQQPQAIETPAGSEATPPPAPPTEPPTAVPVEPTEPPPPTATPKPKLELPTPKPTDAPSPTATQVVAPTP